MLPLSLLKATEGRSVLIELKNGDTFHGSLVNCDHFMNVNLKDITLTSSDGERFWKIKECYIRGNTIKYLRIEEEALDAVEKREGQDRKRGSYRGRGTGRGRGRGNSRGDYGGRGRGRGGGDRGGRGGGNGGRGGRGRGGQESNRGSSRGQNSDRGRGGGRGRGN
mmetsp:Transcript_19777/g.36661  ORF Transcript_19777/g.36661 Transcript_19777/m.36661 type:complete len:165 (-) Transcript_19777:77-571(-)